jgi:hypothetical protein
MADYRKNMARRSGTHGQNPYGTLAAYAFSLASNASGVPQDSNATAALGTGDTIKLGIIPAGTKLIDSIHQVSDAFTASATCKLGFAYVDGVDDAAVPQDDDYFVAALDLNAVAITRKANAATLPVTLPKDAFLVLDLDGAALAAAGRLDVTVIGEMVGAP